MAWGIIGALDKEVELVKNSMNVEKTVKLYGSEWYIGEYRSQKLIVACSGIGKVNAAVCASTMIREFGAKAIVNIGVAGSMTDELGVLDVALSESVAFHDLDADMFSRYYPYMREFTADKALLSACQTVLEAKSLTYRSGRIATGDIFVSDKAVKADIATRLSPVCVEMEGAAIGEAAYMNGVPFLVIRTMSDSADDEAEISFDDFIEKAAVVSAGIVLGLIDTYNLEQREA